MIITEASKAKMFAILERYVPANAVHYCYDVWIEHPFHFRVTKERNTKLGDYRYDPRTKEHGITINHNLNCYAFLLTYIHEVAHLLTREQHKKRVMPHGVEWKASFQKLMLPILNDLVFPIDVLKPLQRYMRNPKASSQADPRLLMAMRNYDEVKDGATSLEELKIGDFFVFHGMAFQKMESKRTRVLCAHVPSGQKYLIPRLALVESHENKME
ncbi:MAG: transcription elongation protein SprT [Cyclobacteriaceae bacterium]